MLFSEFQQLRRQYNQAEAEALIGYEIEAPAALLYTDPVSKLSLHIEIPTEYKYAATPTADKYRLTLERSSYETDNLEQLEAMLFAFYVQECTQENAVYIFSLKAVLYSQGEDMFVNNTNAADLPNGYFAACTDEEVKEVWAAFKYDLQPFKVTNQQFNQHLYDGTLKGKKYSYAIERNPDKYRDFYQLFIINDTATEQEPEGILQSYSYSTAEEAAADIDNATEVYNIEFTKA